MASMHTLCQLSDEEKEQVLKRGHHIIRVLAHGSCSLVYLSEYLKPKTEGEANRKYSKTPLKLVCKVMESVRAPKDFTQKFLPREIANLSRIRSGNLQHIIHVHSILQYKSKVMVFMRYAELGNLCDYLRLNKDVLNEKLAKFWFRQLSVALSFLHTMEVVHRDIKCENILITANYNVKLCDFGFSRLSVDGRGKAIFSNTYCGSMGYAAPELLKGIPYNPKLADVWSMGIVLFVMLNKSMPFSAENVTSLWTAQNNKAYRFRSSVITRTSQSALDLVGEMLEPNWFERINSQDILKSSWFTSDKVQLMTQNELEAMENAEEIRKHLAKPIKNILDSNRQSSLVNAIEAEESPPPSEQDCPVSLR